MFETKPLMRKSSPQFTIKPLFKRNLSPTLDRASFINMRMNQGESYSQAIRSWDLKVRKNA